MRRLFKSLFILLLGLPVIFLVGWFYLQAQLKQAGVSYWSAHLGKVSLHQLILSELEFTLEQPEYQLEVSVTNLQLSWSWPAFFRIKPQTVLVDAAAIQLQHAKLSQSPARETRLPLPADWQIPSWLPQLVKLEHLTLNLPCADTHCQLQARALISGNETAQWQAKLELSEPKHQLTLRADFFYEHANSEKNLQSTIQLDQQLAVSLKQQLNANREASTDLAIAIAPPSAALLTMLADWQLHIPAEWLAQFSQPVQLFATGNWQLPEILQTAHLATLPIADADFRLIARVPNPLIIPGLGWLKGEVDTQLVLRQHQLEQWQLNAELELSHYENHALDANTALLINSAFGKTLAPISISLRSKNPTSQSDNSQPPTTPADTTLFHFSQKLPISLKLSSAAPLQSELQATLLLSIQPELKVELPEARLELSSQAVTLNTAQLNLTNLKLQSVLQGYWQTTGWQLTMAERSQFSSDIAHPQAQAKMALQLDNTELKQLGDTDLSIHSQALLTLSNLQHPQLVPQSWQWQAEISGHLSQLALKAELTNDKGLSIPHQMQWQAPGTLQLNWQLADIFLLAGNPLEHSLTAWPELLTLNRGRLGAAGQLSYQQNSLKSSALLQLRELNGLYDRTLFNGLSSQISFAVDADKLHIDIPSLQLTQLNHGMQMGPLQLVAHYQAPLDAAMAGKLELTKLSMDFMQGELAVAPQEFDLSAAEQQLVLTIQQLDLAELLRQHPTTDLSAHGKLSGRIPVTLKDKQFSVEQGLLAAEQPGGRLQYRTAASAAGGANPGMKLVFDALADFHFSVLSSEVSYSHSGKLMLALQLQGSNPEVQQGRAINLNINLEEDLPAMLASLQLANKLNDTLTKRVQQHIQRQQAAKAAAGEKP